MLPHELAVRIKLHDGKREPAFRIHPAGRNVAAAACRGDGLKIGQEGAGRTEDALPDKIAVRVELDCKAAAVVVRVRCAADRDVAAIRRLADLVEDGPIRADGVHTRPGNCARQSELFDEPTRQTARDRAVRSGAASDRAARDHVSAVIRRLERDTDRIVARRRRETANLLLPLDCADVRKLCDPVHEDAVGRRNRCQRDRAAVGGRLNVLRSRRHLHAGDNVGEVLDERRSRR